MLWGLAFTPAMRFVDTVSDASLSNEVRSWHSAAFTHLYIRKKPLNWALQIVLCGEMGTWLGAKLFATSLTDVPSVSTKVDGSKLHSSKLRVGICSTLRNTCGPQSRRFEDAQNIARSALSGEQMVSGRGRGLPIRSSTKLSNSAAGVSGSSRLQTTTSIPFRLRISNSRSDRTTRPKLR